MITARWIWRRDYCGGAARRAAAVVVLGGTSVPTSTLETAARGWLSVGVSRGAVPDYVFVLWLLGLRASGGVGVCALALAKRGAAGSQ